MSGKQAVIVTGASSGIGLGIALKYLSEGHDVILVGRNLEKLKGAIPTDFKGPGRSLFLAKDVSTLEGCKELIKEGIEMLGGRLDVLVNNAGAGKFDLKLADITPEDWLWHMNTNVNSVMYLTQMAIPHLEATKGSVINISSIAAKRAVPGAPAYAISKASCRCADHKLCPRASSSGYQSQCHQPRHSGDELLHVSGHVARPGGGLHDQVCQDAPHWARWNASRHCRALLLPHRQQQGWLDHGPVHCGGRREDSVDANTVGAAIRVTGAAMVSQYR